MSAKLALLLGGLNTKSQTDFTSHRVSGFDNRACCLAVAQVWLLKGAQDEMYRGMWERAMDEMIHTLIFSSRATGLSYIAESRK